MVRFRYCPNLMFYYLWLKFSSLIIFFIFFLISFIYLKFYLNFLKIEMIIYWKFMYIFISFFSLMWVLYIFCDEIICNFILKINEDIIMRDPQDYINLTLDLTFFYIFLFLIPLLIFFTWSYLLNFWSKNFILIWNLSCLYFLYLFFLVKLVVDNDLFLSNWDYFYSNDIYLSDFQPDISLLYLSYIGEYNDFFIFLISLILFQTIIYLFIFKFWSKDGIKLNKLRLFFIAILFLFTLYFFAGETYFRFLALLFIFISSQEAYFFILLFLSKLKLKKTDQV